MTPHEFAANVWEEATKQGLDAPTEDMIAGALNDAMDNALNACCSELELGHLPYSSRYLERLKKRMYDGEHVLFNRR